MQKTKELLNELRGKKHKGKMTKTDSAALYALRELSELLGCGKTFSTKLGHFFMAHLPSHLKKNNHNFYFLKCHHGYSVQGNGHLAELQAPNWLSSGVEINGECVTAKQSEAPQHPKITILSDVLEKHAPKQYFIGKKLLKRILKQ